MKRSAKMMLFCFACIAFISCDRITKDIAKKQLKDKEPISYMHDTVRLEYVENTGAAMSLGDTLPARASFWLLGILPLAFLLGLFAYTLANLQKMNPMKVFSLALLFSGGIGNIIDRMLYDRHVTDFMNLGIQTFRTGIFNVADMCVTAGAIGLLIFYNEEKKTATIVVQ